MQILDNIGFNSNEKTSLIVHILRIRMRPYPGLKINIRSFFNEKFCNVCVSIVSGDVQRSETALKTKDDNNARINETQLFENL